MWSCYHRRHHYNLGSLINEELLSCVEITIWVFSISVVGKLVFHFDTMMMMIQFNSIGVNPTSVSYKAGTKQIQHKYNTKTQVHTTQNTNTTQNK